MNKKNIYICVWTLFILIVSFYLFWGVWISQFIISIFLYSLISFPFYILWKKLRKKTRLPFTRYFYEFVYSVLNIFFLILIVLGTFVVYQNEISPASMPLYEIQNGKKTVLFQSMIHIWTHSFYEKVRKNIHSAKKSDFVLYYEWVKPWSKENMQRFDEAIGIKFDKELYKNFWRLYGVTFQNNDDFLWLVNNYDFNIDVSIDEVISLYDKQKIENKRPPEKVEDLNKVLIEHLSQIDERKLKVLVYINQALLNFLIKSDFIQESLMNEFWNKALFDVILHKRNDIVIDSISNSEHTQIFVTYGLLHFEWILEWLQEIDPNWKIVRVSEYYPMK